MTDKIKLFESAEEAFQTHPPFGSEQQCAWIDRALATIRALEVERGALRAAAEKLLIGMEARSLAPYGQREYHFKLSSQYAAELSKLVRTR